MPTTPQKSKQRRPSAKRAATSPVTRRTSSAKRADTAPPLFNGSHVSGFVVGLIVGVIASWGVVAGVNPTALPETLPKAPDNGTASDPQPSFTFFTTLEDESLSMGETLQAAPSESAYTQYVLQAGSFRASEDADRRRGELALLGLEASVEEIDTDTGKWHRVYIGPFKSRSLMAKARSLTAQSDIDTLLLKRSQ